MTRRNRGIVGWLLALGAVALGLLVAPACVPGAGTGPDAGDARDDGAPAADGAAPDELAAGAGADLVGTAWRFTSIYATEPDDPASTADSAVRDILNELFARYIAQGVLNVMYQVRSFDPSTGELLVRAGPAMRYADGKLHMLCGYDADLRMRLDGLRFQTTRPEALAIHCGTTDAPATCAPEASAPNAVPIVGLASAGEFRQDGATGAGTIDGASLSGYILAADAERICICTQVDPETGADRCERGPEGGDGLYCKAHCGPSGYAHFGTVLRIVAKVPPVDVQGEAAYRFAGTYGAVRVDDYDAACCTSPESCP